MIIRSDARGPRINYGAFFLAGGVFMGATWWDGATPHVAALILRTLVALGIFFVWPRGGVTLARADMTAPAVAVAVCTLGLLGSPSVGLALQAWVSCTLVALLYVGLLATPRNHTRILLCTAGQVACVHAAAAVLQRGLGTSRGHGGFFSPNDLAAFLAPLWVLGLNAAWQASGRRRAYYGAVAALLAAGLWASASRAGVLAAAAGAACLCLPALRRRPSLALLPAALGLVAFMLLKARWLDTTDPYTYSRWDIWRTSLGVALAHPAGVGLGAYADVLRRVGVPLTDWVRYPHVANNAHNEVLQAWVELGWLGLCASLLPAAWLVRRLCGARIPSATRAAGLGVLVALGLPALTTATLHVPPVAFLAAVWAAHLVRQLPALPAATEVRLPHRLSWLAPVCIIAALPGAAGVSLMQTAAALREAGRVPQAQAVAQAAQTLMPWSLGAAMLNESLAHLQGRDTLQVVDHLLQLAERFDTAPEPLSRAAQLLAARAQGNTARWQVVARLYDAAALRDPHNVLAWRDLAHAQRRAGDKAAAIAALQQALAQEPHYARALMDLAALTDNANQAAALRAQAQAAAAQAARYTGYGAQVLTLAATTPQIQYGHE